MQTLQNATLSGQALTLGGPTGEDENAWWTRIVAELKPLRKAHRAQWEPRIAAAIAKLPATKAEQVERDTATVKAEMDLHESQQTLAALRDAQAKKLAEWYRNNFARGQFLRRRPCEFSYIGSTRTSRPGSSPWSAKSAWPRRSPRSPSRGPTQMDTSGATSRTGAEWR